MPDTRLANIVLLSGTLSLVAGCQMVGPIAIDQGRDRYNHIIESTSKEQTLSNIIRVSHHEPTAFMDVTEVDATTTFSTTAAGGAANIGAKLGTSGGTLAGQTESVSGGMTYSESPLIRYQPLLGQSLVAQLATPVSPDVLAALYDSNWGAAPLLDFAASFLTLDFDEYYAALNVLAELDNDNVIELVAEKSAVTKAKDSSGTQLLKKDQVGNVTLQVTNKASTGGGTDALVIYYLPDARAKRSTSRGSMRDQALWHCLLELYVHTQVSQSCQHDDSSSGSPDQTKGKSGKAISDTEKVSKTKSKSCVVLPRNSIELRTMPIASTQTNSSQLRSGAPLMKTYSALGILKNAAEQPYPRIGFVTAEQYNRIRSCPWNDPMHRNHDLTFYTLLPDYENDGDEKPRDYQNGQIRNAIGQWLLTFEDRYPEKIPFVYESTNWEDYVYGNLQLGHLRRYILIIHAPTSPANAYVSHFDHGEWYYIAGDDEISQKNFDLITLFLTMMAVPSGTPPLSPSISVGGGS